MNKLPNFFIVGAAKAGTSTLWEYLKRHPDIYMPKDELEKEPAYFHDQRINKNQKQYIELFKDAGNNMKRIGEASTIYLTDPLSAKHIYDFGRINKLGIKIIIVLRNPADRAYSLYNWNVQEGWEYISSFKKAITAESKRKKKNFKSLLTPGYNKYNYMYFSTGEYYCQVKRYFDVFGEENVKVLLFEEFIKNPDTYLKGIYSFLGVNENIETPTVLWTNPSVTVISAKMQFVLKYIQRYMYRLLIKLNLIKKINAKEKRDKIMKLGQKTGKPKPLDLDFRKELIEKYKEDILKLEKILNRKLEIWYKDIKL